MTSHSLRLVLRTTVFPIAIFAGIIFVVQKIGMRLSADYSYFLAFLILFVYGFMGFMRKTLPFFWTFGKRSYYPERFRNYLWLGNRASILSLSLMLIFGFGLFCLFPRIDLRENFGIVFLGLFFGVLLYENQKFLVNTYKPYIS